MTINNLLWAEKYRPAMLDDVIISDDTKKMIRDAINGGNIPNMVLHGSAGTGKTSVCKVIANEIGADLLYINASMERSIDVIRDRVVSFSSSVSFSGGPKIVLLDEAEGLTGLAQNSLRGVVEEFTSTRFFFTTNHINKIIAPIRSRCVNISFALRTDAVRITLVRLVADISNEISALGNEMFFSGGRIKTDESAALKLIQSSPCEIVATRSLNSTSGTSNKLSAPRNSLRS